MTVLLGVLGVLAVLLGAGWVAVRDEPLLAEAPRDRADVELPDGPLRSADVEQVRFGLALRGYRMAEVDDVLERLARELDDRDARLARLDAELAALHARVAPVAGDRHDERVSAHRQPVVRPPATVVLTVPVAAPAAAVFAGATDWDRQGEWMLGTRVRGTAQGGVGVGGGIEAFTGVGPLGFLDTMVITRWEPPHRCHVLHTGRLVRGTGWFDVEERGPDASVFVWREDLDLPLGALGRLGWPLVKPLFAAGVQLSLKRFARWVEAARPAAEAT